MNKTTLKIKVFLLLAMSLLAMGAVAQNITGHITCDGKGVAGVAVSDGYELTQTDANGYYAFTSAKKNGYVFYTLPSGYEPEVKDGFNPQFWAKLTLTSTAEAETHDFTLKKVNNDKYIMIVGADTHLAKRTSDLSQFSNGFIKRLNEEVTSAGSTPIYSTILGDLAWDGYWYANNFNLSNFMQTLVTDKYPLMLFPVMGNHDNDPAVKASDSTDFVASAPFRSIVSPNYYSYNLGKVHYIVVDDIFYLNDDTGGTYSKGVVGSRNYYGYITDNQIDWIKKDLALVDKSTPVIVELHIPTFTLSPTTFSVSAYLTGKNVNSTTRLCDLFKDYKKVMIWSGHTHYNYHAHVGTYPNVHENNIAAVCGTWWWTGKLTNRHICKDGSPSGYEVYKVDGDSISWEFHSIESNGNAQFRVYDMNVVRDFYANDSVMKEMFAAYPSRTNYGTSAYSSWANTIFVNVFNYDTDWKVEATEDGKALTVTRTTLEDPLHTLAYDRARYAAAKTYTADFTTNRTAHAFKIQSPTANGTIMVRVTDSFGHVFTKEVKRPYAFSVDMPDQTSLETGVNDIFSGKPDGTVVRGAENALYINAATAGYAKLISANGTLLKSFNVVAGINSFRIDNKGLYIVNVNGKGFKVIVR